MKAPSRCTPLPAAVDQAVRALLDASTRRVERNVAVVRILLAGTLASRSAWTWVQRDWAWNDAARAWIAFPAFGAAIAFSVLTLVAMRKGARPGPWVHASVAVDAVTAFGALLTNVLWPWAGYQGIAYMPDVGLLIFLTLGAGLRQSPSASLLGGSLFGAAFAALALLDARNVTSMVAPELPRHSFYAALIAASAATAYVFAVRTHRTARQAARAAVQLDVTGKNLGSLLRDHHDLRAWLASATLDADIVARSVDSGAAVVPPGAAEALRRLRDELAQVHVAVDDLKARTYGELAVLEGIQPVRVAAVVEETLAGVRPRYPGVVLVASPAGEVSVDVSGGAPGLRRVLLNLVLNACEGDGTQGAARVEIRVERAGAERIRIEIVDDGPGFAPHLLDGRALSGRTTKREGTGLGLGIAERLVEASRGALAWSNRDGGGARVAVELDEAA